MEQVLNYLLKSGLTYFKTKGIHKGIEEDIGEYQVSNGIRALHEEGYIKRYNRETWTWTKKGKKLRQQQGHNSQR